METLTLKPGRRQNVFNNNKKSLVVRPDSPKTREACLSLGYDASIFKLKTFEEFQEPGVSESVQRMRFEHYKKKTKNAYEEIGKMRKMIMKKNQKLVNLQLEKDHKKDEELANDLIETYNKKMTKLSEQDGEQLSFESFDDEDPILVLEQQLDREIKKYKKSLGVKAKEIQHQLDNEKRRHQLQQELDLREQKIQDLKDKLQEQKQLRKKKMQKQSEQKFSEIKRKEREQNQKQIIARTEQLEQFDKLRAKLREEEEKRRKTIQEYEQRQQDKFKKVQYRKSQQDDVFNQHLSYTLNSLQFRQNECSSNRTRQLWEQKLEKLNMRMTIHEEKRKKLKMTTEKEENEKLQQVILKMAQKEDEIKNLQLQRMKEEQQKVKDEAKRKKKIAESLQLINSKQIAKVNDLEKKFLQVEENHKLKKEENDVQTLIKKEKFKLKQQDLHDNYLRQERLKDFRFKQVIKINQQHNEQKSLEKLSNELIKKAQQELQRKLKQENETLDASLMNVSQADSRFLKQKIHNIKLNGVQFREKYLDLYEY